MKRIITSFFFISLLLAWGCDSSKKNANNKIVIGAILDQTGPNAVYGKQVKDGIDLALEQINSKGGINDKTVEVIFEDAKGDTKQAVGIIQKFISLNKINLFIGEIGSNVTASMIPFVEKNGGFLFAPASSSPKLSNVSPNFARNWPSDDAEAGSAAEFAFNQFKAKTSTIIYVNSDYGMPLKDKFTQVFESKGGKVLSAESYVPNTTDFKILLTKVKGKKADCIYLAGNPKEMGICVKQMGELQINVKIVSNTGFLQDECLKNAGAKAEGVIIPTPSYNPKDSTNTTINTFGKAFFTKYKVEPNMVNANAYDALFLIKEAIEKDGPDPLKIATHIRNKKNFSGAAGIVSFSNGEVQAPIIYMTIKNGKPVSL